MHEWQLHIRRFNLHKPIQSISQIALLPPKALDVRIRRHPSPSRPEGPAPPLLLKTDCCINSEFISSNLTGYTWTVVSGIKILLDGIFFWGVSDSIAAMFRHCFECDWSQSHLINPAIDESGDFANKLLLSGLSCR